MLDGLIRVVDLGEWERVRGVLAMGGWVGLVGRS